jgi:hypothetical protein
MQAHRHSRRLIDLGSFVRSFSSSSSPQSDQVNQPQHHPTITDPFFNAISRQSVLRPFSDLTLRLSPFAYKEYPLDIPSFQGWSMLMTERFLVRVMGYGLRNNRGRPARWRQRIPIDQPHVPFGSYMRALILITRILPCTGLSYSILLLVKNLLHDSAV